MQAKLALIPIHSFYPPSGCIVDRLNAAFVCFHPSTANLIQLVNKIYNGDDVVSDNENMTLEEKCEHLMNIVVESRKRFGKMCTDYEQKTSLVENKMLNLQIETISNYRFKSKVQLPNQDPEEMYKELENFTQEIKEKQKRIDILKRDVKNTQNIVLQLNADNIGRKLKEPLTAEAMLSSAKNKNNL